MATTWNPWNAMEAIRRDIDRAFANTGFSNDPLFRTAFLPGHAARRYPLINLSEDRENVYIEALAPGIDPGSLDLAVLRNVLTITGEKRRHPGDIKPEAFHRSERAAGKFVRTVDLPVEVEAEQVKAAYKDGLLSITLPKAAAAKPRQINVQVAS